MQTSDTRVNKSVDGGTKVDLKQWNFLSINSSQIKSTAEQGTGK